MAVDKVYEVYEGKTCAKTDRSESEMIAQVILNGNGNIKNYKRKGSVVHHKLLIIR